MKRAHTLAMLALSLSLTAGADENDSRTVVGPRNMDLAEGADEIAHGDVELGLQKTLRGLEAAVTAYEREVGLSNLCAGYAKLRQLDTALRYCNLLVKINDQLWRAYNNRAVVYVLLGEYAKAELDLQAGEALNPDARRLKETRVFLRNAVSPVTPSIMIDDRLDGPDPPTGG